MAKKNSEDKKQEQEQEKDPAQLRRQDAEKLEKGEDPFENEEVTEIGGEAEPKAIKAGEVVAPRSNPGAAARVPSRPLQPESLQSHGKGILSDKDLGNPPYNVGEEDALKVDEAPSGSGSRTNTEGGGVDKAAEREKAESQTSRERANDPDNPTIGYEGKGDATASHKPIGSKQRRDEGGGSDSGSKP